MLPKNHKQYIKPTAEKLDQSPVLIQDAVDFYYSALRKSLNHMKAPLIQVENLGTFSAKSNKLVALIQKYRAQLDALLRPKSFFKMGFRKDIENKLRRAENLKLLIELEKKRKQEFISKKKDGSDK